MKTHLSTADMMTLVEFSEGVVRGMLDRGEIRGFKRPGRKLYKFSKLSVRRWLAAHERDVAPLFALDPIRLGVLDADEARVDRMKSAFAGDKRFAPLLVRTEPAMIEAELSSLCVDALLIHSGFPENVLARLIRCVRAHNYLQDVILVAYPAGADEPVPASLVSKLDAVYREGFEDGPVVKRALLELLGCHRT